MCKNSKLLFRFWRCIFGRIIIFSQNAKIQPHNIVLQNLIRRYISRIIQFTHHTSLYETTLFTIDCSLQNNSIYTPYISPTNASFYQRWIRRCISVCTSDIILRCISVSRPNNKFDICFIDGQMKLVNVYYDKLDATTNMQKMTYIN